MEIIRNEQYIATRARIGTITSFLGLGVLIGGMVLTFFNNNPQYITIALLCLPLGWLFSQIGLYFANRFVRSPRPDERIDEGLGNVKGGRLYHYVLPVPHVILSRAGIITIVSKYQSGDITVDGYNWKQTNIGFTRRMFGQENLGNPSIEAEYQLKQVAKFIGSHVPELAEQELPIGAVIVFTTKDGGTLDLKGSDVPALHYTKLKGFWKQRQQEKNLDEATYQLLRDAFDEAAGDAIYNDDEEDED